MVVCEYLFMDFRSRGNDDYLSEWATMRINWAIGVGKFWSAFESPGVLDCGRYCFGDQSEWLPALIEKWPSRHADTQSVGRRKVSTTITADPVAAPACLAGANCHRRTAAAVGAVSEPTSSKVDVEVMWPCESTRLYSPTLP